MDQVLQLEKKLSYYSISRPLSKKKKKKNNPGLITHLFIYIVGPKEKSASLPLNAGAIPMVRTKAKKLLVGQKVKPYSSKKVRILTYPELRQNQLVS